MAKYAVSGDTGAGRDALLGSTGGKVALALANPDDCRYFTRLAGKRTVRTRSTGTQRGSGRSGSSEGYAEHADDLIHEWEWQGRIPTRDGLIAIKGGENSRPGREGVFQIPVAYASETPAAAFFGLGTEEECDAKRIAFRRAMERRAAGAGPRRDEAWVPDFGESADAGGAAARIDADEWSAWD